MPFVLLLILFGAGWLFLDDNQAVGAGLFVVDVALFVAWVLLDMPPLKFDRQSNDGSD